MLDLIQSIVLDSIDSSVYKHQSYDKTINDTNSACEKSRLNHSSVELPLNSSLVLSLANIMVFANTLHQNRIVIILPSPVSEIESKVFLFSEFSSSFILAAGPCILGRGSKCPGVGTGLLEQYGILRAWKQIVKRKV